MFMADFENQDWNFFSAGEGDFSAATQNLLRLWNWRGSDQEDADQNSSSAIDDVGQESDQQLPSSNSEICRLSLQFRWTGAVDCTLRLDSTHTGSKEDERKPFSAEPKRKFSDYIDHDQSAFHRFRASSRRSCRTLEVTGTEKDVKFPRLSLELTLGLPGHDRNPEEPIFKQENLQAAALIIREPDMQMIRELDPEIWKIRKELTKSDVDSSSRLLLSLDAVEKHILRVMGDENLVEQCKTKAGSIIRVYDVDTASELELTLKRWKSGSFVLVNNWKKEFVTRRNLKQGDQVGFYWDSHLSRLCITCRTRH